MCSANALRKKRILRRLSFRKAGLLSGINSSAAETLSEEKQAFQNYFTSDFNGETIAFIYQPDYYSGADECEITCNIGDVRDDVPRTAVYKRTQYIETNLNIKIADQSENDTAIEKIVNNPVMGGDSSIDSASAY